MTNPNTTYGLTERNLRLSHLSQQITGLLYEALQAHALGTLDAVSLHALPARQAADLAEMAEALVMELAPDRAQLADVAMRAAMRRQMDAEAITIANVAGVRSGRMEQAIAREMLTRLIDAVSEPTAIMAREGRVAYRHSLARPDTRSPRAQEARAALNIVTRGA